MNFNPQEPPSVSAFIRKGNPGLAFAVAMMFQVRCMTAPALVIIAGAVLTYLRLK